MSVLLVLYALFGMCFAWGFMYYRARYDNWHADDFDRFFLPLFCAVAWPFVAFAVALFFVSDQVMKAAERDREE